MGERSVHSPEVSGAWSRRELQNFSMEKSLNVRVGVRAKSSASQTAVSLREQQVWEGGGGVPLPVAGPLAVMTALPWGTSWGRGLCQSRVPV